MFIPITIEYFIEARVTYFTIIGYISLVGIFCPEVYKNGTIFKIMIIIES